MLLLQCFQIDLLFFYFGKAISYKGVSANRANLYPAEDYVEGEIHFENNISFKGIWDFNVPKEIGRAHV